MPGELTIRIESDVDSYVFESLEDKIRDLLELEGLMGEIKDEVTGNIVKTRKEELGKIKDSSHKNIIGKLILGEKIWFNDDLRCRLRICGWTNAQIDKLKNAKFIDLSLVDSTDDEYSGDGYTGSANVLIYISQFADGQV